MMTGMLVKPANFAARKRRSPMINSYLFSATLRTTGGCKIPIDLIDATPVGDLEAFHYYLFENIEYPGDCVEQNIEGRVFISCIVQKDGSITHAEVTKSAHPSLDAEALRVIRYAPNWIPATSAGKPIATKVIIPISFDLMN